MRRTQRLLEEQQVDPRRVLVVTFTRTAASDLVKELRDLGAVGCERIRAGTLHSLCFGVLRKDEVFRFLGRHPRPLIVVEKSGTMQFEGAPLVQDLAGDGFGNKRQRAKRIRAFEAAWARLQHETPGWPVDVVDLRFDQELHRWLQFHQAMLIGELVAETLRYLRNNPVCAELGRYDHVLVDEYQDLNKAEQVLVDLLAGTASLVVVGDEDQSIYRFRHAHPDGIVDFPRTHAATQCMTLIECRRCPKRVVELASRLIERNHAFTGQRLQARPTNRDGTVHIVQWETLDEEKEGLAAFTEHLIVNGGCGPGDILILCPRRLIGYAIRDAISTYGIPVHSFYHEEALEEPEAQEAFALLELLANPHDRVALRFWLGYGSNTWLATQYEVLRQYCEQSGRSPWDTLSDVYQGVLRLGRVSDLMTRYDLLQQRLQPLADLRGLPLVDALFPANKAWARALREASLLVAGQDPDAETLVDHLRAIVTQPQTPEAGDFVRVMSLHKSKGLKSKVVIVAGCIEGLIPTYRDDDPQAEKDATIAEQRRLFYVGITRTTDTLVLSSTIHLPYDLAYRMGARIQHASGQAATAVSSTFIDELGPNAPRARPGCAWQRGGYA